MESLPTRDALLAAGRRAFADRGYAGARLADIAADTGMTTGAFYRHFASKNDFFAAMFADYGEALIAALTRARTLKAQLEAWLLAAREHRGVVRAAQELSRGGSRRRTCAASCARAPARCAPSGSSRSSASSEFGRRPAWWPTSSPGSGADGVGGLDPGARRTRGGEQLDRLVRKGLYKR